jgi:hypothetical protein
MKLFNLILMTGCVLASSTPVLANSNDDIFSDAFDGMFDRDLTEFSIESSVMDNPPPPVPLDGGLTALLAAGAAVGYRRFRAKSPKQP